jgi:hypothetical protein
MMGPGTHFVASCMPLQDWDSKLIMCLNTGHPMVQCSRAQPSGRHISFHLLLVLRRPLDHFAPRHRPQNHHLVVAADAALEKEAVEDLELQELNTSTKELGSLELELRVQ